MSDPATPPAASLPELHAHVAMDKCYWAIIDAPPKAMKRPGLLPIGLLADAQAEFPVPLEDLHAVAAPLESGKVLACAIAREVLESRRGTALTVTPDQIPSEFGLSADTSALNLLVGEFQPAAVRNARWKRHALVAATVTVCSALVAVGLTRRASHLDNLAAADTRAADQILTVATPDRREQTLAGKLEQARRFAALVRREKPLRDAVTDLESLLTAWPRMQKTEAGLDGVQGLSVKTQSLSVLSDGANVSVSVEGGNAAAAEFLKSFTPPPAFTLDEPRLTSVGPITRLNLHLRHAAQTRNTQGSTP